MQTPSIFWGSYFEPHASPTMPPNNSQHFHQGTARNIGEASQMGLVYMALPESNGGSLLKSNNGDSLGALASSGCEFTAEFIIETDLCGKKHK